MQLVPYQYRSVTVQFASQLKRKCLLYPEPASKDNPSFYFPIDFNGPPPKAVTVPVYPGGQIWFGRIISSDNENRKSNLKWFTETHSGIYTLSTLDKKTDLPKFAS